MCDKSRNTWLCVHWQWNTLEWCQLNALQASPVVHLVTPLSCVSFSMNTQPSVPAILPNYLSTTSLRQANVWNYMKKIFFTFDFHILPEHRRIGGRIFHCRRISTKTAIILWGRCYCWPNLLRIETVSKSKSRSYVHIETYYCKPQLISWR